MGVVRYDDRSRLERVGGDPDIFHGDGRARFPERVIDDAEDLGGLAGCFEDGDARLFQETLENAPVLGPFFPSAKAGIQLAQDKYGYVKRSAASPPAALTCRRL